MCVCNPQCTASSILTLAMLHSSMHSYSILGKVPKLGVMGLTIKKTANQKKELYKPREIYLEVWSILWLSLV